MIDSYVCIDTGNSGTKIVYSCPETNEFKSLFMSSALAEVTPERMENQLRKTNWIGFSQLKEQARIEKGDSWVAVGSLAEEFSPEDRRAEPKYENALYKILAAIGVIVDSLQLSKRKQFRIQLGLLLPWNEYKDQERLKEELKRLALGYRFCERTIKVKIQNCICFPEGGGIAMWRSIEKGLEWVLKQRAGFLVLGDRNWTAFYVEAGKIVQGASPLNGFSFLLDRIIEDAPCLLKQKQLCDAIFTGIDQAKKQQDYSGRPRWGELESIQSLATARNPRFRESEIKDIDKAITMTAIEWDEKLKSFIKRMFPRPLSELNIAGGSIPFFAPFIEEYFNCALNDAEEDYEPINITESFTPVIVSAGMVDEVTEALQFKSITDIEAAYPTRFVDVFCLTKGLITQGGKLNQKKPKQKARKKAVSANATE